MNHEPHHQLTKLAFQRSKPFCYPCYKEAPTGCCQTCLSDDLMRLVDGVGCEYGTDWVIDHILATELTPVDLSEAFEQFVADCYPATTKVGWCEFDTVTLLKEQDPVSWGCAQSDWESQEAENGALVSFDHGSNYYSLSDVENLLAAE